MCLPDHATPIAVYPYKHLPIPDGAVLVARPDGPNEFDADLLTGFGSPDGWSQQVLEGGEQSGIPLRREPTNSGVWLAKRILQKFGARHWRRVAPPFFEPLQGESGVAGLRNPPRISALAARLLPGVVFRLDQIAQMRRRHQVLWDAKLTSSAGAGGCEVETDERPPKDGWTPYLASFRVDSAVAEDVYEKWVRGGLPVMTWPDLPPEVKAERERHTQAWSLRHSRLYLPVHQTLRDLPRDVTALTG